MPGLQDPYTALAWLTLRCVQRIPSAIPDPTVATPRPGLAYASDATCTNPNSVVASSLAPKTRNGVSVKYKISMSIHPFPSHFARPIHGRVLN